MLKKQRIALIALLSILLTLPVPVLAAENEKTSAEQEMRDITTMDLVREMGIGINLGNTMESCGDWIAKWGDGTVASYETAWGSPVITQEMIEGYARAGFGVLRIPVAWSNMMGDNYTIKKPYIERVQELVDWTLEAGMYAIINIHYDGGWVNKFPEEKEECMKHFIRFWEQISENFKHYGDHLMFESQNEELGWSSMYNPWGGPSDKEGSFALANEINQTFVDVVRKSGGNNPERHLLISGYNTSIEHTCDPLFQMPQDPAGRCAVSVHYYTPSVFAILEEDADWGKMRPTWGTEDDLKELYGLMDQMKTTFIDKGIPVIIGEYGCPIKNKEPESVLKFISSVCAAAYERQMCPVLWDTPGVHYDRTACTMSNPELHQLLLQIPVEPTKAPTPTVTPTPEPTKKVEPTELPESVPAADNPESENGVLNGFMVAGSLGLLLVIGAVVVWKRFCKKEK